ncbi:hypothetical protein E2C01_034598 [Portunus trituberculatus]|uniref:Uncharacterized protein n=1 Tax=Portunus trituberculatus TaxID=210409 RepID=A0A5B7F7C9_PORTR|nr:hypothetical protein [Portunus trituberculatus]
MLPQPMPRPSTRTQASQHKACVTACRLVTMLFPAVFMWVTTVMGMWSGKEEYLEPVCLSEDLTLHITSTETTVASCTVRAHTFYPSVVPTLTLTETEASRERRVTWVEVTVNPEPIHVTHTSRLTFSTFVMHLNSPGTTVTHTSVNTAVLSIALTRQNLEDVIVTVTADNTVTTTVEVPRIPSTVTVTSTLTRTMRRPHTMNGRASGQPRRPIVRIVHGGGRPRRPNGLPSTATVTLPRSTSGRRSTSHM